MKGMSEYRVRTRISEASLEERKGKILTWDDVDAVATGPSRWFAPDGRLLFVYLPATVSTEIGAVYDTLHELKKFETDNRGMASGSPRLKKGLRGSRTRTAVHVASSIIGAFEASGNFKYCRLTAFTSQNLEKWQELYPLLRKIASLFEENVPDRYARQMQEAIRTRREWTVPGTPFTTVTVNNTYPTGVHTDKGDLEAGFSTLAVLRRGDYQGGHLCFPEYRIAVDMQDGDLLLMDAHQWHGNLPLELNSDNAERISVVSYFRTEMVACGTAAEENARALQQGEKLTERLIEQTELAHK